jgi:hypothetical protein
VSACSRERGAVEGGAVEGGAGGKDANGVDTVNGAVVLASKRPGALRLSCEGTSVGRMLHVKVAAGLSGMLLRARRACWR